MTDTEQTKSSYGLTLAVVGGTTFLGMLAYAGPLGNATTVAAVFGEGATALPWILASMSIGLAIGLLPSGVIADQKGRGLVFGLGAVLFASGNVLCSMAPDARVFVIARVQAGIGAAGMIATGLGLVAGESTDVRQRATTATWWSVAMGAGIALGPVITGLLDQYDWRIFYWALAAGVLLPANWAFRNAARSKLRTSHRKLDVLGLVLLTCTLLALVTAIVEVRAGGAALGWFVVSAVWLIALVLSQRFGRAQLVDPALFRRKDFLASIAAGLATGLGVIAAMSYSYSYLVTGLGTSTLVAGLMLTLWAGVSAVAALALARLTKRISGPAQLIIGLIVVGLGLVLLALMSSQVILLAPGLTLAGLGSGLLNTGLARQAVAAVPAGDVALGTAANNTARYLGAAIGVTIASVIGTSNLAPLDSWRMIAWLTAGISFGFAALVAVLSRGQRAS